MPEQHIFEYAVIRVVPRVEREEFINVGVILFCKRLKFLQCLLTLDDVKLTIFASGLDLLELKINICAFENICQGNAAGGPIAQLDIASRFRWLTATRSTVLQTSKVHPGLCTADANKTLVKLHNQLVL